MIKSKTNERVFGGYSNIKWKSNDELVTVKGKGKTFVFAFNNDD